MSIGSKEFSTFLAQVQRNCYKVILHTKKHTSKHGYDNGLLVKAQIHDTKCGNEGIEGAAMIECLQQETEYMTKQIWQLTH